LASSWQFAGYLFSDYHSLLLATFVTILVWSLLFVIHSASYQTGLFFGLISYFGVIISRNFAFLILLQATAILIFMRHKSYWYKQRMGNLAFFGVCLALLTFVLSFPSAVNVSSPRLIASDLLVALSGKSIFILAFLGMILLFRQNRFKNDLYIYTYAIAVLLAFSVFIDRGIFASYCYLLLLIYLTVVPIDILLMNADRKNALYLVYIIVALLDSHLEGRLENFIGLFANIVSP
jgi:hypothetical protein